MWDIVLGAALVVVTGLFVCFVRKDISNHKQDVAYRNKIDTFKVINEFYDHFKKNYSNYWDLVSNSSVGKSTIDNKLLLMTLLDNLDSLAIKYYNLDLNLDLMNNYPILPLFQLFDDESIKTLVKNIRQLLQPSRWANAEKMYKELKSLNKTK